MVDPPPSRPHLPERRDAPPPRSFGRFQVIRELGRGDVAVSDDGALVASGSLDGWLHVSHLDGRPVASLDLGPDGGDRVSRLAFRPGSPRTLLVGTGRGLLRAIEVRP